MEQVLTGSADSPAIMATTALESTPPDRKAPSGTSEIMRMRVDSRRRSISSTQASASDSRLSRQNLRSQYSRGAGMGAPRRMHRLWPGSSFRAALKMVRGSGT